MKWLIICLSLLSNFALAQFDSREDVSMNFTSFGEMRGEEVKRALLHQAASQAMEKFAVELGFDFNGYQNKLVENFQEYYEQKLEVNKDENLSAQEAYKRRQLDFYQYSKHSDLLKSYSFISSAKNSQVANQWQAVIQLSLDSVKLQRLMRRTLQADSKKFSKLWLIVETNIHSFKWSDIGLERESSFSQALGVAWKNWWGENLPANFDEVELCHEDCLNYLRSWQVTSRSKAFNPDYSDGVWLNISYDIYQEGNGSAQFPSFKWESRVVFTDINTKKALGSLSNKGKSRGLRGGDLHRLNSTLASQIFASTSGKFTQMKNFIEQVVKLNQVGHLSIEGHQHLGDVIAVKELIKTRGSSLGLEIELDHFSQDKANLLYFYQGEAKAFRDLLNRINELKSSKVYELKTQFENSGPVMKLSPIE